MIGYRIFHAGDTWTCPTCGWTHLLDDPNQFVASLGLDRHIRMIDIRQIPEAQAFHGPWGDSGVPSDEYRTWEAELLYLRTDPPGMVHHCAKAC